VITECNFFADPVGGRRPGPWRSIALHELTGGEARLFRPLFPYLAGLCPRRGRVLPGPLAVAAACPAGHDLPGSDRRTARPACRMDQVVAWRRPRGQHAGAA
jgi:hypothetical protein